MVVEVLVLVLRQVLEALPIFRNFLARLLLGSMHSQGSRLQSLLLSDGRLLGGVEAEEECLLSVDHTQLALLEVLRLERGGTEEAGRAVQLLWRGEMLRVLAL
jgi:hypothetical protein